MAVPIAEIAVVAMILGGLTRVAGVWALALLALFTGEAIRAWRRLGARSAVRVLRRREPVAPPALLVRNIALAVVA